MISLPSHMITTVSSHPVVSSTEVSPAPQKAVQELVEKLSAIAQQNGLVFDVSSLSGCDSHGGAVGVDTKS